ncbi:hypothetical protein TNCT_73341 [Trichonephila clavata]|uniref:Uncharacterized protein n=1 Tax=Trichonephila clavata TaxID=2740835 RepID=A0A8X6F9G8_TRICU|nr:hypothetical protein TNCT_73341 [Trichonephila clavata]
MPTKGYRAMIKRFDEKEKLIQVGGCCKRITPVLVDYVKTVVDAHAHTSEFGAVAFVQFLDGRTIPTALSKSTQKQNALLPIEDPPCPGTA